MISRRRATTLSILCILILARAFPLSAQRSAPAQRGGTPRSETPQLVVSALSSSDPAIGAAAADAIRTRMQAEHSATDLYLTPRLTIDATLKASGYNPDSALSPSDLLMLAKQVRGDYALSGTVERTTTGVRTWIRLLTARGQQIIAEPMAPVLGSDLADVAKQVDRAVSEALHALEFNRDCMNALVAGDYARARAAAQQGLKIRPTSVAINGCVLATLRATHASPDSVIAVAHIVTATDTENVAAWRSLADAYAAKGDTIRALDAARALHRIDPVNPDFTSGLVDRLVGNGQADLATALLDTALRATPGNPALLRKQWLLQLRLGRYAAALASGAALVAADSTNATVDYYERQLAAAKAAHDSTSAHRIALDASTHFPKDATFLLALARDAVDGGSPRDGLRLLERVLATEPANALAWQLGIAARTKTDGADSAVATARRALAAGVAKDSIGASVVASIGPALAAAQSSQKRADWEVVLRVAQAADSVVSTPRSNFYVGIAAYQIASDDLQSLSAFATKRAPPAADRRAACASATRVEGLVTLVTTAMPKGGSADPTIAAKVLRALPGISDFVNSVKQASCRPRPDDGSPGR